MYIPMDTCMFIDTYICINIYMCMYIYVYTYMCIYIKRYMYFQVYLYTDTCMNIDLQVTTIRTGEMWAFDYDPANFKSVMYATP